MVQITPATTMAEIERLIPTARRTLFQKWHVGGCQSCGFSPQNTLQEVIETHDRMPNAEAVIQELVESDNAFRSMEVKVGDVAADLKSGTPKFRVIDVRMQYEKQLADIAGTPLLDQALVEEILTEWDHNTPIVFYCHSGMRSMDAAAYFHAQGFANVKSMAGGIDAWSREVDAEVPRY